MTATLVVTFDLDAAGRAIVSEALGDALGEGGRIVALTGLDAAARAAALRAARVVLTRNTARELAKDELPLLAQAALIQFIPAGIDFIPIGDLPPGVPAASNAGAYSGPMAEHAMALILAAAKRLLHEHAELARGVFNQQVPNRMLAGLVGGIYGFGGIGQATARLMRAFGMRVQAVNRRGTTAELVDWIGGDGQLDTLLAAADVLVISAPLTRATLGRIGARELCLMKPDAILVNLARGEIVDEAALFAHLKAQPRFTACIDAWWVEPVRHGQFRMDHPFMTLPNVIGSPHNSGVVPQTAVAALRSAAANCRRALRGEPVHNLIRPDDRLL
jgi:phosphoglycerate dehydrogenase-like enzyme